MMTNRTAIIGAFSESQISRLTGLTIAQLRRWNKTGFIRPAFQSGEGGRSPFTYIYSFKDLLKLRVLNQLRNVHGVSLSELRKVENELADLGDDRWTSARLWVLNRKVVFTEPESSKQREITSKQFVAEIPLEVVTTDARKDIAHLNLRDADVVGKIEKKRHLHSSEPVFMGTRITVSAIKDYIDANYSDEQIISEFPELTPQDILAAKRYKVKDAA